MDLSVSLFVCRSAGRRRRGRLQRDGGRDIGPVQSEGRASEGTRRRGACRLIEPCQYHAAGRNLFPPASFPRPLHRPPRPTLSRSLRLHIHAGDLPAPTASRVFYPSRDRTASPPSLLLPLTTTPRRQSSPVFCPSGDLPGPHPAESPPSLLLSLTATPPSSSLSLSPSSSTSR